MCYGSSPSSEGAASGGVVCFHRHDCLLGFPCVNGMAFCPHILNRYRSQVMYLVHAIEKFHVIPWLMIEFGFCALWSFFFFTAALAFAVKVRHFLIQDDPLKKSSERHHVVLYNTYALGEISS